MVRTSSKVPVQALTVFMIKTGVRHHEDALKEAATQTRYRLKRSLPFRGTLFLAPQRTAPPRWLAFVQDGADGDLQKLFNASTSAVLFLRASRRTFAFTFGYGRALLRAETIERSFGLRVVLNTVDPAGLLSVDSRMVQELTVHTRRQASRGSRIEAFGLDTEQDLVGAMTGTPRDQSLARTVSGADALLFRGAVQFPDLGSKCKDLLRAYRSHEYKRCGFGFIDHVRAVRDPTVTEDLDQALVDALIAQRFDRIHLAPPRAIDWDAIDGFSFTKTAEPDPDLSLESFFAQIRKSEEISVDRLRRQHVFVHTAGAAEAIPFWSVYDTLVAECDRGARRFVLSGGDWYEIEKSFAGHIAKQVGRIKSANIGLPAALAGENEGTYNMRAAATKRGVYLTDKQCLREAGDPIELCDLYTSKRQFVHVKRWKASSTLSHLFAQGLVSAETLVSDEKFRDQARELLGSKSSSLRAHIPKDRPNATLYQVVYAVIIDRRSRWRQSLPFFSQINMVRSAERLARLGFDVRSERIGLKENPG